MSEQKKLVPKLRFPEFQTAGEWVLCKLKDACKVNPANSGLPEQFVYIDLESVDAGKLTARKIINSDEAPSRAQRVLSSDDVIFQIVRPYQRNNFHFKPSDHLSYVASTGYAQLRAKSSSDFLFQAIHVDGFVERVIAKCTGSSYPAINSSDLAEISLAVPEPKEQQKIADCLSSLDELIVAQGRKVDALKTHKKGLMQQLFPREGETQPRLRFPEFRDAGEWVLKTLEDITPAIFDGTHQTPTYTHDGVPFFSVENLISGNANKFISREDYVLATKKNKPEKNDILLTRIGKVGYSQVVTWTYEFSVYVTLAVIKNSNAFISHFLNYSIQSDFYQSELRSKSLPNAVPPKINLDSLRSTKVFLTTNIEQQRIADCLSLFDALITAATQELDTLKTHKKGLMQQLFPKSKAL